jgi:hypothetical protein
MMWPNDNALGRRVSFGGRTIGLSASSAMQGTELLESPGPMFYLPLLRYQAATVHLQRCSLPTSSRRRFGERSVPWTDLPVRHRRCRG